MPQGGRFCFAFGKILFNLRHTLSPADFSFCLRRPRQFLSGAHIWFYQDDRDVACTRQVTSIIPHWSGSSLRSARWRRYLGPMERNGPGKPVFFTSSGLHRIRQLRPSQAGRIHEDFLVAAGGKKKARTFHDFSRQEKSPGRPECPSSDEQYSLWLR